MSNLVGLDNKSGSFFNTLEILLILKLAQNKKVQEFLCFLLFIVSVFQNQVFLNYLENKLFYIDVLQHLITFKF